jgi:forkhead transcription factor HCM1
MPLQPMPLQPMRNPPVGSEIILNAPMMAEQRMSPVKSQPLTQAEINYANLNYIPIPPPQSAINLYTDSPVKRPTVPSHAQFHPMQMMQQQSLFTTFDSNFGPYQQENILPTSATHENFVDFPEPSYLRKQTLKRSYSDVEATVERPFKKAKADDLVAMDIPAPEDMPPVVDDGNKPNLSYAQMIGMAILRAPNRRLTLSQIYEWISNTFAYYREDTKQSWHNSIRHNLSLHKAFIKKERPKGDAGKGCYWMIEPGTEGNFFKDKNRRGNLSNMSIQPGVMRPELMKMAQPLSDALTPNLFINQSSEPPRPRTAPALPELSSDATLPASDPALNEQEIVNSNEGSLPQPKSSPPDALNSSPPVVGAGHHRNISSPTARMQRPSSAHRQKRIFPKPDDSGYFSSIESSALRPNKNKIVLTSELDIEPLSKKRAGRAEEEIARLRASSHDITPSHARFGSFNGDVAQLSSPVRLSPTTAANPVTPAVRFKKPQRPPPSISPNTQLHLHRQAMQDFRNSPMKGYGLWQTDVNPSSPYGYSILTSSGLGDESFEIFSDPINTLTPVTPAFTSSPLKLYQSRPPLGRAVTSGNVLTDMDGSTFKFNAKTPSRSHLLRASVGATHSGSPLKSSMNNATALDVQNDLFDFNSFENDMSDNDEGVDILQGFGKIGDSSVQIAGHSSGSQHMNRPSLGGRSVTSLF